MSTEPKPDRLSTRFNKEKYKKRPDGRSNRRGAWDELDMPNKLDLVAGWIRDGASNLEIAEKLGVGERVIYTWKNRYPQFEQVLRRTKEIVDNKVIGDLLRNATYHETREERKEVITGKDGKKEIKEYTVVREERPNFNAQKFWLTHRRKEWQETTPGAGTQIQINILGMSDEERDRYSLGEHHHRNIPLLGEPGDNGDNGNAGGNGQDDNGREGESGE